MFNRQIKELVATHEGDDMFFIGYTDAWFEGLWLLLNGHRATVSAGNLWNFASGFPIYSRDSNCAVYWPMMQGLLNVDCGREAYGICEIY